MARISDSTAKHIASTLSRYVTGSEQYNSLVASLATSNKVPRATILNIANGTLYRKATNISPVQEIACTLLNSDVSEFVAKASQAKSKDHLHEIVSEASDKYKIGKHTLINILKGKGYSSITGFTPEKNLYTDISILSTISSTTSPNDLIRIGLNKKIEDAQSNVEKLTTKLSTLDEDTAAEKKKADDEIVRRYKNRLDALEEQRKFLMAERERERSTTRNNMNTDKLSKQRKLKSKIKFYQDEKTKLTNMSKEL